MTWNAQLKLLLEDSWIKDYVDREQSVAWKQVQAAETVVKQDQEDIGMLKRQVRQPECLRKHLGRHWMLLETVKVVLPVTT